MDQFRVTDVFVPGGLPKHTYVPRAGRDLEPRVRAANDNLCKIVTITGATKAGKTVLARQVYSEGECVWLDGGSVHSLDDFWDLTADQLNVVIEETESSSTGSGGELSTEFAAEANAILAKGSGKVGGKKSVASSRGVARKASRSPKGQSLQFLKRQRVPLIIDDFHYLPRDLQGDVTRVLKPLVFDGVPVIYLAIPHRRYDAIKVEREMNGRVEIVEVPSWTDDELGQIAQLGFPLLNVKPDPTVSRNLAGEAQGSPHLMQEFCRSICIKSGIHETVPEQRAINPQFNYTTIFEEVANNLGKNIFDRLARGPRPRADRKPRRLRDGGEADIYKVVLVALAELKPGVETLEYEPLRASIRSILDDDLPQAHEVSRVLEHMARISSTDESSVPVIDYEKDERKLHITDPFFAFFLRWGRAVIDA